MTLPEPFTAGVTQLLADWGFSAAGIRHVEPCTQQLQISEGQHQQLGVWLVSLTARTSFAVNPMADPHLWSFRTTPQRLNQTRRHQWKLRVHTVDTVLTGMKSDYEEVLAPFLAVTSTPSGLIRWIAETYQPLMLVTPSILAPVQKAWQMVALLPEEQRATAERALQGKRMALKAAQQASQ